MAEDDILVGLRERVERSAFHRGLGLRVEEASPGEVRLSMEVREDHLNLQGLVHGGLLATLADTAMGLAVLTAVGPGRRYVTVDLSIRFLRPARPGRIEAVGRTERVGTSVGFAEASVTDGEGTVLVRASGTYAVGAERPTDQ